MYLPFHQGREDSHKFTEAEAPTITKAKRVEV